MKYKIKKYLLFIYIIVFISFIIVKNLFYNKQLTFKNNTIEKYYFKNNKYGLYLLNKHANTKGDYKTLLNFYDEAIKQNNKDFLNQKFLLQIINNNEDKNIKVIEKEFNKNKNNITLGLYLSNNYFINKNYDKSLKILNILKNGLIIKFFKAWNLTAKKQYDKALDLLENELTNKFSSIFRKYILMHMGHIAELADEQILADECYKEVLETENPNVYDIENIISFYIKKNENKKVLEILNNYYNKHYQSLATYSLLKLYKEDIYKPRAINNINEGLAKAILDTYYIISFFQLTKQSNNYIINLSLINKLNKDLYESNLINAELYKNFNKISISNQLLNNIPDSHYLSTTVKYNKIKYLLLNNETKKQGLDLYNKLLEENNIPLLYFYLAEYYKDNKEFLFAINNYDKALSSDNKLLKQDIFFKKAQVYNINKNKDKTLLNLEESLKLNNTNPAFLNYYGYFLVDNDIDINKGISLINKAILKESSNVNFLDSLGLALFKKGSYTEAVKVLELARNINPKNLIITNHLADVYWKIGRTREAIFEWNKILNTENLKDIEGLNLDNIKEKIKNGI